MTEVEAYKCAIASIIDDSTYDSEAKADALKWMYRALSFAECRDKKEDFA